MQEQLDFKTRSGKPMETGIQETGIEFRGKLQAMQKEYQKTMKHGEMTKRPKKNKLNRKATINS